MDKIKVLSVNDIKVVKTDKLIFNKGVIKGWALYIEGLGYMAFKGQDIPYVIGTKKWATAVKEGWSFDWEYTFVTPDKN